MLTVLVLTTVVTGLASLVFSFGNVRSTLIGLGWEPWLASLYTPAVDVTVISLILVTQYLVTAGIEPERLRKANRLLAGAGLAMLGANVAPSLLTGYFHHQPAAYGRALADAVLPAILIAWSHIGPYLLSLFAEIRSSAEAAALEVEQNRTWATEADRAAAAQALHDARTEAERILEQARTEVAALRAEASDELAAAVSIRRLESEAAEAAERERVTAQRRLEAEMQERERRAETDAAGLGREAELMARRAQAELTEARRIAGQAASDRAAAEAERKAAAEDLRTAEDILVAAERAASRPSARRRNEDAYSSEQADRETITSTSGRLTIDQRVKLWQEKHPRWREQEVPDQKAIAEFFPGLKSADTISKFRKKIEELKAA